MSSSDPILVSSDSHVFEPHDLWQKHLASQFGDTVPVYEPRKVGGDFQAHEGGWDPRRRGNEMAADGVGGEILYPSLALDQFGITQPELQEACFKVYNDWLIDYCSHDPERLFGVAAISVFDTYSAVQEMERCRKAGMRGVMIWQVPPQELSFASDHYERFWAAAQDLNMPVSLHILTGAPYVHGRMFGTGKPDFVAALEQGVTKKLGYMAQALTDIIGSGVLERFPRARLALIEAEISWIPFVLAASDKYAARKTFDSTLKLLPSEYFERQVFASFFNDPPSRMVLDKWGAKNCMWSNDFPHPNSTWPNSREVIARDLSHLKAEDRARLLHDNVVELYDLPL